MDVLTKQRWIATWARENPQRVFTSLNHLIDEEWLLVAYNLTRKDGAVGIDGQTAKDFEQNLVENLQSLLRRFKEGSYKASPAKRAYIPKENGDRRPIGILTLEDRVLQRALTMILEPIYEQDFLPVSYGFRPNRSAHQALDDLWKHIMGEGGQWVLEVDIRKFFDNLDLRQLRSFLDLRVKDGLIRRTIDKWLKVGVIEDGQLKRSTKGTQQGSVTGPLLSNIYLHYVLDTWFAEEVVPRMEGRCSLTRFADDFVIVFERASDCQRVFEVLEKRFAKYGLSLHPEKTQVIDFRPHMKNEKQKKQPIFDFLGLSHLWGRSRKGKMVVLRRTSKSRLARAVKDITMYCKKNRHKGIEEQHRKLTQILIGHYAYYGITGNYKSLARVKHRASRAWHKWLSRRSWRSRFDWESFQNLLIKHPLPKARIYHGYT